MGEREREGGGREFIEKSFFGVIAITGVYTSLSPEGFVLFGRPMIIIGELKWIIVCSLQLQLQGYTSLHPDVFFLLGGECSVNTFWEFSWII